MTEIRTSASHPELARPAAVWLALVLGGVGWGLTGPLSKVAVSTGHHPVGIAFWETLIGVLVLSAIVVLRGERLPLDRRFAAFFLACGLLGTALPNSLSYTSYAHLPVGIVMMVISLVPMTTLLLALPLGLDSLDPKRLTGLLLGVLAVMMIALPETSLPDPSQAAWVLLPVMVTLSYSGENVVIARFRPEGISTLAILCGLNWAALLLLAPTVVLLDGWVSLATFGPAEAAILGVSVFHLSSYFIFIWLIGQAGPVFASQTGYVVTGSGVLLGMVLFGERHSLWVWGALVLMMAGLALVQPRRRG